MASPSGPIGARTDEGPAHTPTVRDHVFTAGLAGRLPCARGLARRSPRRIAAGSYAAGLVTPPRLSPSSRVRPASCTRTERTGLFVLFLSALVYSFLAGLWLMRTLADVVRLARR